MNSPNCARLVETAMELRAHHPAGWDQFTSAMNEYAAQILSLTMSADPAVILRAQGMAIQAGEIAKILRDAPNIHAQAIAAQIKRAQLQNGRPPTNPGVASIL